MISAMGQRRRLPRLANTEAAQGVTTIVPATMTLPEETLMEISKIAGNYKATEGADLAGINMEGPFISLERKGHRHPHIL